MAVAPEISAAASHRFPADWDGFFTPKVVICRDCGAVDRWTVQGGEQLRRQAELPPGFIRAISATADRVVHRRASDMLRHLRALADAAPNDAVAWRRLANALSNAENDEEAIPLWQRALELDPNEVDAVGQLMVVAWNAGQDETSEGYAIELVRRWCSPVDREEAFLPFALVVLSELCPDLHLVAAWEDVGGPQPVVNVSTVRIGLIPDVERAAAALCGGFVKLDVITSDVDDRDETRLGRLLGVRYTLVDPRVSKAAEARRKKARKAQRAARKKQRGR